MSSEEQRRILKMVEDGKISADEAMILIRALEQCPAEAEMEIIEAAPGAGSEKTDAPEFEEVAARARRFAMIPLWIGVGITTLFAGLMYWAIQSSGFGFWFYCLTFPFLLGVLVIALSAGGSSARWLFVDVHQKPGEKPARITFGFPVPLRFLAWILRTFGHHIHGLRQQENASELVEMLEKTVSSKTPLIVNVDDDDGEKVRLYIG
jgi:hypothetical protein